MDWNRNHQFFLLDGYERVMETQALSKARFDVIWRQKALTLVV